MGSVANEALQVLAQSRDETSSEFKGALTRVSAEVKERLNQGAPASADFVAGTLEALARIRGTRHAELRLSCAFDCGLFFYLTGRTPLALQAARQLSSLAHRADSKQWIRKAHNLFGMVHADVGGVAEAVLDYSKAL